MKEIKANAGRSKRHTAEFPCCLKREVGVPDEEGWRGVSSRNIVSLPLVISTRGSWNRESALSNRALKTNRAATRGKFLHSCFSRNSCPPWVMRKRLGTLRKNCFPASFQGTVATPSDSAEGHVDLRLPFWKARHWVKGSILKLYSPEQHSCQMLSGKRAQRLQNQVGNQRPDPEYGLWKSHWNF